MWDGQGAGWEGLFLHEDGLRRERGRHIKGKVCWRSHSWSPTLPWGLPPWDCLWWVPVLSVLSVAYSGRSRPAAPLIASHSSNSILSDLFFLQNIAAYFFNYYDFYGSKLAFFEWFSVQPNVIYNCWNLNKTNHFSGKSY